MFSTLAMTIEIQKKNLKSVINSKSIIIQEFRLGQPQPTNFEKEFDSNLKLPHFFKRKHNNFFFYVPNSVGLPFKGRLSKFITPLMYVEIFKRPIRV